MAVRKCSMINEIDDSTDMWKIVVRVLRRWNSYQRESPTELYAICFLLVNQEGNKIQASIMNKFMFKKYEKYPFEGQTYFMANLEVIPNGKEYKAARHKFKLLFNSFTYVKDEDATIPHCVFSFFPITDILKQTVEKHTMFLFGEDFHSTCFISYFIPYYIHAASEKHIVEKHTMFLFDVIGFILNIGPLEEYRTGTEVKNKMRLILADEREQTVQMVLYDECAINFCMNDFNGLQKPIVLVAQLVRIGFDEMGTPEVCSSFHATKIHLNPKFEEAKQFVGSTENLPSPTISSINDTIETQKSNTSVDSMLRNTEKIKVAEITLQEVDKYFVVLCEIKKFETRYGWVYEGCSRCGTKPKFENGSASCSSNYCRGKPCTIVSKFRLNYMIADDSGTASVVFFDKHASELLKNSAAELKSSIAEEELSYGFPSELNNLVGKKMMLKMRLNKYNRDHPNSSVSVATYAECADLMDEFNEAASKVGEASRDVNDVEEDFIFFRNATMGHKSADACVSLSERLPTIDLDDVSISGVMATVPSKGKRKIGSKKPGGGSSNIITVEQVSPVKASSKPMKSIKQEKN